MSRFCQLVKEDGHDTAEFVPMLTESFFLGEFLKEDT